MDTSLFSNLLTPAVLFFFIGMLSQWVKSDLSIPPGVSKFLSLYLMMAIGFKGGVHLAEIPVYTYHIVLLGVLGLSCSFLQPFMSFFLLKRTTSLDRDTMAVIAAQTGSISLVTFLACTSYLKLNDIAYAGYIIVLVALMEAPAILSGILLAKKDLRDTNPSAFRVSHLFNNSAVFIILSSFLIGALTGEKGLHMMEGFITTPFQGLLSLFLLDMGIQAAQQISHLKDLKLNVILFGIYIPIIGAALGMLIAYGLRLDLGTATLFTLLTASASYIAVPAAMRVALPKARPSVYLPLSLAITFPFNIIIGIPLYFHILKYLL